MSHGFKFEYLKATRGKLTPSRRTVAVELLNYADANGDNAHPGIDRLAEDCLLSRSTVKRNLEWLRENGWVVEQSRGRKGANGHGWASVYSLTIPAESNADGTKEWAEPETRDDDERQPQDESEATTSRANDEPEVYEPLPEWLTSEPPSPPTRKLCPMCYEPTDACDVPYAGEMYHGECYRLTYGPRSRELVGV